MIPQGPFRTEKQVKRYAAVVRERDEARSRVEQLEAAIREIVDETDCPCDVYVCDCPKIAGRVNDIASAVLREEMKG